MPVVEMPPMVRLTCDECDEDAGSEEFGGYFLYEADDIDKALSEACFHRLEDGRIVCDGCAYELNRAAS